LALGAIIGVPPAILGVLWTRHHGGLPTFSFARPSSPETMPAAANLEPSSAGAAVAPSEFGAGAATAAPSEVANVARPLAPRDAASAAVAVVAPVPALGLLATAEAASVRAPRARSKAPLLATTKRPVPPPASAAKVGPGMLPVADPTSTTILPPSGL
jgi:hypothetical protein